MFNLEQAIADWRHQTAAEGIKGVKVLDELESHLREEIDRQRESGKGEQEAFGIATHQLGDAVLIRDQFRNINNLSPWQERIMIGICGVFIGFILFLSSVMIVLCYSRWTERVIAWTAVGAILLVALFWRRALPWLPVIGNNGLRWAAGLGSIAIGITASNLFLEFILPRFEMPPDRQLPAIGLWAVFLIALFVCAGIGMIENQGRVTSPAALPSAPHSPGKEAN